MMYEKFRAAIATGATLLAILVAIGGFAYALPTDLDSGFGTGGRQIVNVGVYLQPLVGHAKAVAVQSDGKILMAGATLNGTTDTFAVARLNPDGSYDHSFDGDGSVAVIFGSAATYATALAVQPDGKIVVAGYTGSWNSGRFAIARLNPDGSLDSSFADSGKALIAAGPTVSAAYAIALQTDGKIVLAGYAANESRDHIAVIRLNRLGRLDTTFDGDGKLLFLMGVSDSYANGVAVQSDGKIVIAGYGYDMATFGRDSFAVARLNSDGSFDGDFATGGKRFITFGTPTETYIQSRAYAIALQSDGKIVLAGSASGFAVARLNTNGSLDSSFDGDGKNSFTFGSSSSRAHALALRADGKIVLAGSTVGTSYPDFALAQLTAAGSLDSDFGSGGKLVLSLGTTADGAEAVTVQRDGKIVVAGYARGSNGYDNMAVQRISPTGALDKDFYSGIVKVPPASPGNDYANAMEIQSDGKIVVTGTIFTNAHGNFTSAFGLMRLNSDGNLDSSFNGSGKFTWAMGDVQPDVTFTHAHDVAAQSDGKLIVVGDAYSGNTFCFAIARVNANGGLDTSFNGDGKLLLSLGTFSTPASAAQAVAVQSDGKIVVAGYANSSSGEGNFAITRLNANGTLDASFGTAGKLLLPVGTMDSEAKDVIVQSDGKIVVAGYAGNSGGAGFGLVRLNSNGSLDTSFNGTGKLVLPTGSSYVGAEEIVIQDDGKIVVVGTVYTGEGSMFGAARIHANGTLDSSFGSNGKIFVSVGIANSSVSAVALQPDGKIVLAGYAKYSDDPHLNTFALVRLDRDGRLDRAFTGDGKHLLSLGARDSAVSDVAVLSNGKIVVAGGAEFGEFTQRDFAVAQLLGGDMPALTVSNPRAFLEGSAASPGSTTFNITLSAPELQPVTINYATADGLAKAGEDYVAKSGTLTFAPGQTRKAVSVNFTGDSVAELNETFFLDIRTPVNATIVDSRGSAYIGNDDGPQIFIDNARAVNEGNSGMTAQTFVVRLSAASTNTITVDWANSPNTAGPADYVTANGRLTFNPGETQKTITIQIKGDTTVEPNETYRVNLTRPTFAIIADSQGVGYILNDDAAPSSVVRDAPSK